MLRNHPDLTLCSASCGCLLLAVLIAPLSAEPPMESRPPQQTDLDSAEIQRQFGQLDLDEDGDISNEEAQANAQLLEQFEQFDFDYNHKLSPQEYHSYAQPRLDPKPTMEDEEEEESDESAVLRSNDAVPQL